MTRQRLQQLQAAPRHPYTSLADAQSLQAAAYLLYVDALRWVCHQDLFEQVMSLW
jgi:hypothetical protein